MKNLIDCKGKHFICEIADRGVSGRIQVEHGYVYLCQDLRDGADCEDKIGYDYSWFVNEGTPADLKKHNISNFRLVEWL